MSKGIIVVDIPSDCGCCILKDLVDYCINGKNVEYSDGIKGTLKIYPGYPECGVITDDGFELLYTNVYYACEALHQYLTEKTESSNGLYEKRQNK